MEKAVAPAVEFRVDHEQPRCYEEARECAHGVGDVPARDQWRQLGEVGTRARSGILSAHVRRALSMASAFDDARARTCPTAHMTTLVSRRRLARVGLPCLLHRYMTLMPLKIAAAPKYTRLAEREYATRLPDM